MGKMKNLMIDRMNNSSPDDTDWNYNQLDPAPDEIDLESGKSMWIVNDYKIWATTYQEAVRLVAIIDKF